MFVSGCNKNKTQIKSNSAGIMSEGEHPLFHINTVCFRQDKSLYVGWLLGIWGDSDLRQHGGGERHERESSGGIRSHAGWATFGSRGRSRNCSRREREYPRSGCSAVNISDSQLDTARVSRSLERQSWPRRPLLHCGCVTGHPANRKLLRPQRYNFILLPFPFLFAAFTVEQHKSAGFYSKSYRMWS